MHAKAHAGAAVTGARSRRCTMSVSSNGSPPCPALSTWRSGACVRTSSLAASSALARRGVAPPQRRLGALLRLHGQHQRRYVVAFLQHRDLGELQTLGWRFPLVFIRAGGGNIRCFTRGRRRWPRRPRHDRLAAPGYLTDGGAPARAPLAHAARISTKGVACRPRRRQRHGAGTTLVRIACPAFHGLDAWRGTGLCMMRCTIFFVAGARRRRRSGVTRRPR